MNTLPALLTLCLTISFLGCRASPQQYVDKGNQLLAAGKIEEADINYRNAVQRDPAFAEGHYRLGLLELRRQENRAAFNSLSRAVELAPNHDESAIALANLCLGVLLSGSTPPPLYYEKVSVLADGLLARNPRSFDGLRFKAFLAMIDRKPKQAISLFAQADAVKPGDPGVNLAWTQNLLLDGQDAEAIKLAGTLIERHKEFLPIYDALYSHYSNTKHPAEAEAVLRRKANNNPANTDVWMQLCSYYLSSGRAAEASVVFEQLLGNPAVHPQAQLAIGDVLVRFGRPQEALLHYQEGIGNSPRDKNLYRKRIASTLVPMGRIDESRSMLDSALKDSPDDLEARTQRGALSMAMRRPEVLDSAIADLEFVASKRAGDSTALFNLGKAYEAKGRLDDARLKFIAAQQAAPQDPDVLLALAQISLRQSRFTASTRYASLVLEGNPKNSTALLTRAVSHIGSLEFAAARKDLASIIGKGASDLEFAEASLQMSKLALAEGKSSEGEQSLLRLYKPGNPDLRPLRGLALLYQSRNEGDKAIQLVKDELKRQPDSIGLHQLLGETYVGAAKPQFALEEYKLVAAKAPDQSEAHLRLGQLQLSVGDSANGVASLERARQLAPKDVEILGSLAIAYQQAGRFDQSTKAFDQALQLRPDDPSLLNNYAYLLAEQGTDLDHALRMARNAMQKIPDVPQFADTVGYIYLKHKQSVSATQIFNNLVLKHPQAPTFTYHLGLAKLENGDATGARECFTKALALNPEPKQAAEISAVLRRVK